MNLLNRFLLFLLWLTQSITIFAATSREGRIAGGEIAEPHSHPYVVSLQSRVMWRRYRVCGGSIVSRRWILSAGHCVTDYFAKWLPMDAIVGAHSLAKVSSDMIYPITHRIAHPYYRGGVGPYDIGMMRTSREIEYSARVQPIMLPVTNQRFYRNQRFLITGWGALQASLFVLVLPNKLREAEVTYLPYYDCYRAINHIKDYYERNPLVKEHNICTGPTYGGVAGCTGDSGGPLVQYLVNTGVGSSSPIPMTTDRPNYTTTSSTTSQTSGSSSSPKPMTTNRPSSSSTYSTTTYRTTTASTSSPMPVSTDRPMSSSPMPISTDRPSTMTSTIGEPSTMESSTEPIDTEDLEMETESDIGNNTYFRQHMNFNPHYSMNSNNYGMNNNNNGMNNNNDGMNNNNDGMNNNNGMNNNGMNNNREDMIPVLVGVISWGVVPCGYNGAPTVYTNVSKHMDFINEYLYS